MVGNILGLDMISWRVILIGPGVIDTHFAQLMYIIKAE
jgi:hypothetical protein